MTILFWVGVFIAVVSFFVFQIVFYVDHKKRGCGDYDSEDIATGITMGFLISLLVGMVWPIAIPVLIFGGCIRVFDKFVYPKVMDAWRKRK